LDCGGYEKKITFRDDTIRVSEKAKTVEIQKWAVIRAEDLRRSSQQQSSANTSAAAAASSSRHDNNHHLSLRNPESRSDGDSQSQLAPEPSFQSSRFSVGVEMDMSLEQSSDEAAQDSLHPADTPSTQLSSQQDHMRTPPESFSMPTPSSVHYHSSSTGVDLPSYDPRWQLRQHAPSSMFIHSETATTDLAGHADTMLFTPESPGWEPSHHSASVPHDEHSSEATSAAALLLGLDMSKAGKDVSCTPEMKRYYIDHWEKNLVPRLPAAYSDIYENFGSEDLFRSTILAIAAADIASTTPKKPPEYFPTKDEVVSFSMYNASLAKFTQLVSEKSTSFVTWRFSLILLLALFELGWGTVGGSVVHLQEIDELVLQNLPSFKNSKIGRRLVCCWMMMRSQIAADCSGENGFAVAFRNTTTEPVIAELSLQFGSPAESLAPILAEGSYFSRILVYVRIIGSDPNTLLSEKWRSCMEMIKAPGCVRSISPVQITQHEILANLTVLRRRLDKWHNGLPPICLPYETFTSTSPDIDPMPGPDFNVKPLYFHSNVAALDYLRYCVAQLRCSVKTLDFWATSSPQKDCTDPWALLVVRILAGLEAGSYADLDDLILGIPWLLSNATFSAGTTLFVSGIEAWMKRTSWETAKKTSDYLPMSILRGQLSLMRKLASQGRQVYLMVSDIDEASERRRIFLEKRTNVVVGGFDRIQGKSFIEVAHLGETQDWEIGRI
jgi:hypothetical protein